MRLAILLLLTVLSGPAFAGKVFACKDAKGATSFQHTPCAAATQQKLHTFQREADAPTHVAAEAEFVANNEQQRQANQSAQQQTRDAAGKPLSSRGCITDRFTPPGKCLDYMAENEALAKQEAAYLKALRRSGARTSTQVIDEPVAAPPSEPQIVGIDGRPSSDLVPIGGDRVKDMRTGEKYNTISTGPDTARAVESPAQVYKRLSNSDDGNR